MTQWFHNIIGQVRLPIADLIGVVEGVASGRTTFKELLVEGKYPKVEAVSSSLSSG